MPVWVHSLLCTVLITALSPCWDHGGCCRKNIVPKRRGCWLFTLCSKSGKRRLFFMFFLALCHKIGLDNKIKRPGCVTSYKSITTTKSTLQKSRVSQRRQTFNKTLCWGMVLQGVSNKLSVIMVSKSCLFLLCVKLEAKSYADQLREMKSLYSSLWLLQCSNPQLWWWPICVTV